MMCTHIVFFLVFFRFFACKQRKAKQRRIAHPVWSRRVACRRARARLRMRWSMIEQARWVCFCAQHSHSLIRTWLNVERSERNARWSLCKKLRRDRSAIVATFLASSFLRERGVASWTFSDVRCSAWILLAELERTIRCTYTTIPSVLTVLKTVLTFFPIVYLLNLLHTYCIYKFTRQF